MNSQFKLILISPTDLSFNDYEGGRPKPHMPKLSLAYLSEWLYENFKNEICINIIEQSAYNLNWDEIYHKIESFQPDMVGITSFTFNILGAYKVAELVKRFNPNIVTVLGGPHASTLPFKTLKECKYLDICVIGEGEITLQELITHFKTKRNIYNLNKINGLAYRTELCEIATNSRRDYCITLDLFPFPRYEKYLLSKFSLDYCPLTQKHQKWISILASRGCIFNCNFCTPVMGRIFRVRNPYHIIEEINFLMEKFKVEIIYFEDSCLTTNKKWFLDLCGLLIESKLYDKVKWGFQTRVDLVDKVILTKAVEAGCIYINYGLESGSDRILKLNNKGITVRKTIEAIQLTRECGISIIHGSFILGLPFETHHSIKQTLNFIKDIDLDMIAISLLDIYPGTSMMEIVDQNRGGMEWIPNMRFNWSKYSRESPQAIVGELTAKDLNQYYEKAKEIIYKKTGILGCI